MKKILALTTLAVALTSPLVMAADDSSIDQMHKDYMQSMGGMKDDMHSGVMSNDPDVAFAKGMLPHHQGAVDMARIQLKYGKDPEMRALAENIIKAQDAEMAQMKAWLKAHPEKK
jgi:uncharacterized protein (DUF305 family)